jgi:hypothetical protein
MGFGESSKVVPALLNHHQLDFEQGMFMLVMRNNSMATMEQPFVLIPLTQI